MSDDKRIVSRQKANPFVTFIEQALPSLPEILSCDVCGSWRRGKSKIGDLDIAVQILPGKWIQARESIKLVLQLEGTKREGKKYFDGLFAGVVWVNFWLYDKPENRGAMLLHCTGSGGHNEWMRGKAKAMGLKLNQYGLFHLTPAGGEIQIAGEDERGIFAKLGMEYVDPQDREVGAAGFKLAVANTGNDEVALLLHRIGKEYQARQGKTKPGYHPSNRFKATAYLEAAKVAAMLPPKDWKGEMGKSTYTDANLILESGHCPRMDALGLGK